MSIMHLLVPEKEVRLSRVHMTRDDIADVLTCHISPKDAQTLGIKAGSKLKIKTKYGKTEATTVVDEGIREGMVFVPVHPKANPLFGILDPKTIQINDYHIKATLSIPQK